MAATKESLHAAAADLLDALEAVEWSGNWPSGHGSVYPCCPFCSALKASADHTEDCKVMLALAKARGR